MADPLKRIRGRVCRRTAADADPRSAAPESVPPRVQSSSRVIASHGRVRPARGMRASRVPRWVHAAQKFGSCTRRHSGAGPNVAAQGQPSTGLVILRACAEVALVSISRGNEPVTRPSGQSSRSHALTTTEDHAGSEAGRATDRCSSPAVGSTFRDALARRSRRERMRPIDQRCQGRRAECSSSW